MGKAIKIIGGVVVVLGIAAVAVPALFGDKVAEIGKQVANDYIKNATVDFSDYSLSIFSSFPDLQAGFDDVAIIGKDRFEGDTLLYVGKLRADVDILSALSGDIKINGVAIEDLVANAIVTADSLQNWDVIESSDTEETEEETDTTSTSINLNLEKFTLSNINLSYVDSTSQIAASINGLNADLTGSMNGNIFDMDLNLTIDAINAELENTRYVNNATLDFTAKATADLDSMKFTFDENELNIAGLPLAFDGWVQLNDSSTALDMKLAAQKTEFKTIMDLIPEEYLKSVEGLETKGTFELYAKGKGEFIDMEHLPQFAAALRIKDGYVKYPDLPKSLNDINVTAVVLNTAGTADSTKVSVDTLHIELGGNPFDVTAHVSTPISNLVFDATMDGRLDLGSIKDALPLDSMDIDGIIDADLKVAGDLNSINNEKYDNIYAKGSVGLQNFLFEMSGLSQSIKVSQAKLAFSPKSINLNPLDITIGQSDVSFTGNIEDYFAFLLSDGTLNGSATLKSSLLECNELLALASGDSSSSEETTTEETTTSSESTSSDPLEIPTNINFSFDTNISKVLYDKLTIENVDGIVTLKNGVANLSNLSMNTCDGKLALSGKVSTPKNKNAQADVDVALTNVNINTLVNSFSAIDSVLPIAKNAYGNVSISLDLNTELDSELSPIMKSVNATGTFKSSSLELKDSEFQNKLSTLLNNDKYNDLTIKDCSSKFTITDGDIVIADFPVTILNKSCTFGGRQGLDQTMEYNLSMPIARSEISSVISSLGISTTNFSEGDDIPVGIIITGELSSPKLKIDTEALTKAVASAAADQVKSQVTEKVTETVEKLASDEKTQEVVSSVKDKLNNLLNKNK